MLFALPAPATAQGPVPPLSVEPMPWVAVDVRAGWPAIGQDELTAAGLGVPVSELPGRALTGLVGIHAYPIRRAKWKVGVGAELLLGRGRFQRKDAEGEPVGEPITRTLESVTWQASLNFGRGQGWSYVTVGSGLFTLDSFRGDGPGDSPGRTTLNAGAGARWFKWRHVGFTVDLRFYLTKASEGAVLSAPRGAKRIVVLSAGLSFK
jgi:hypothetical protein